MSVQGILKVSVVLFILQLITGATSDQPKNKALTTEQSVSVLTTEPPKDNDATENHQKEQLEEIGSKRVKNPPPLPNNPEFLEKLEPLMEQLKEKKPGIWEQIQKTATNLWNKFGWGKKTNQPPGPLQPVGQVGSLSETSKKAEVGRVKQSDSDGPNNYQTISPVDQSRSPIEHNIAQDDEPLVPIEHEVTPDDKTLATFDHKLTPYDEPLAPIDHNITPVDRSQDNLKKQSVQAQGPSNNHTVEEGRPQEPVIESHKRPELVEEVPTRQEEVESPGKQDDQAHQQEETQQHQQPSDAIYPIYNRWLMLPQAVQPSPETFHEPHPQVFGSQSPVAATLPPFKPDLGWAQRREKDRSSHYAPPPLFYAPPFPPPLSSYFVYTSPNYDYFQDKKRGEDYGYFLKRLLEEPE